MINLGNISISLYWLVLLVFFYTIFIIFIFGKIEKRINEKNDRIKELEEELFNKNSLIKENNENQIKEKDFIENLLDSSRKFTQKFESKKYDEKKKIEKNRYQKGKEFEWQVCHNFKKLNFEVDNRSARLGRNDKGIDILAKKDNVYTLIQCKNFATTTKIKHKLIKEFNSNCIDFINKNKSILNEQNTRFLFIISNYESLQKCALYYLNDNNNKCEYMEIKYIES
mgnify:CR=1 FL=1